MSTERDIAKFAALMATGLYAEDQLLEMMGGDESMLAEVAAIVGATAVTAAASTIVSEVVDTTFDVVENLNPFSW